MSSRGATWRGKHHQTVARKYKTRKGQRNRLFDDAVQSRIGVGSMSYDEFRYHVDMCRSKVAHKSWGAAHQAKMASEEEYGKEMFEYECPICGKWHLTSHPWEGSGKFE